MSVIVVQLSDVHLKSDKDPIFQKAEKVADAIISELLPDANTCFLLIAGDSAFSGKPNEYAAAKQLYGQISERISNANANCETHCLVVPGNHDCDFSGDQAARDLILDNIHNVAPSQSLHEISIAPQAAFFEFSSELVGPDSTLTQASPFYRCVNIACGPHSIRFHLLNSAWMSSIHEAPGSLTFPIEEISPNSKEPVDFAISVLHHPFNWFRQPDTMRPLREKLESISDLILTGHEHSPDSFDRVTHSGVSHGYLEGGVLQDSANANESSFNIIALDFDSKEQKYISCNTSPV